MCSCHDWFSIALSVLSIVVSVVSLCITTITNRRYVSGNVQIIKDALSTIRLDNAAEILDKAVKEDSCDTNPHALTLKLYIEDKDQYAILREVFHDLNLVCDLISAKALPSKVRKSARREVVKFLANKKVFCFVELHKKSFPTLSKLAKEFEKKSS